MKKLLALLLTLLLALSLCACEGGQTPPKGGDDVQTPATALCMTREMMRLYAQPLDGSEMRLLADAYCQHFNRMGSRVIAGTNDGRVLRIDLRTGQAEELFTRESGGFTQVSQEETGFVFMVYSMNEGCTLYQYEYGAKAPRLLVSDHTLRDYALLDGVVYYSCYNTLDESYTPQLVAYDLGRHAESWRVDTQDISSIFSQDGQLYVSEGDESFAWYAVNTADGSRTAADFPEALQGATLLARCSGGDLVQKYSDEIGWRTFFVTPEGKEQMLEDGTGPDWDSLSLMDREGDIALLCSVEEVPMEAFGECLMSFRSRYFLFNGADGSLQELTALDENQKLFADGDFPVFDCSTARKPVVRAIYEYFCPETGTSGTPPVCSTTHLAWLALADGTSDIALLAAPTEEEQAYLREKGVEAEMKLYGGDGLVFIGNRAAGVEDLTLDQIRAIYRGEITNWSQLGGADQPIRVLYRDDQSGSQRLFEKLLWGAEEIPDFEALGFDRFDEMAGIVNECLYDPYTIGYSIMTYLSDVFNEEELLCFSLNGTPATAENVAAGTYPLGTRGYVVIRADEPEGSAARRLFDWFGCSISDELLTAYGITPLHE